ncbi:MAG: multicopper oxidase family protein [Deltaproteobacteria bacterium]|nr:multicopper oxidase family protein [Deltaproteobacteria bacterium]
MILLLGCAPSPGDSGELARLAGDSVASHGARDEEELRLPEELVSDGGLLSATLVAGALGEGYGYNGASPGPTLRASVGDTVEVRLDNQLDDSTTIHWHGMSVPNEMDGVSFVVDPVDPGSSFQYRFTADRAGTFWYHPHVDVSRQVDLGLYGVVVVGDAAEPVAERDLVLVFDAAGELDADAAHDDEGHHHALPDPRDTTWLVNGQVAPTLRLAAGERARARLLNASNTAYLSLDWPGARLVAGEQGLLGAEGVVDGLLLAPGQRAEVEIDAGIGDHEVTTAMWTAWGGAAYGDPVVLLQVIDEGGAAAPLDFAFAGAAPTADPAHTDLVYTFQGGAAGEDWLINGEAWPDVTPAVLALGAEYIVEARNLSSTNHPFHLHGFALELLSVNGDPPAVATRGDTFDIPIRATVRMRLLADNPGSWALHCHLLGHEDHGMMTVVEVR